MPELPEVEVLVRHLRPILRDRVIHGITARWPKVLLPDTPSGMARALVGRRLGEVRRRGKYLLFDLVEDATTPRHPGATTTRLIGHLGMTGRMFVQPKDRPLPKHATVTLDLGPDHFVFEDTRHFGRFNLDARPVEGLGPEPLDGDFSPEALREALRTSRQPIKVKLLDQSVVAGVGNIYASEALHRARLDPRLPSRQLTLPAARRLVDAIREVLTEAIRFGSTVPLGLDGTGTRDGLFYYGQAAESSGTYEERLQVYDRAEQPCHQCGRPIHRLVQAGRSTFWCSGCQRD